MICQAAGSFTDITMAVAFIVQYMASRYDLGRNAFAGLAGSTEMVFGLLLAGATDADGPGCLVDPSLTSSFSYLEIPLGKKYSCSITTALLLDSGVFRAGSRCEFPVPLCLIAIAHRTVRSHRVLRGREAERVEISFLVIKTVLSLGIRGAR